MTSKTYLAAANAALQWSNWYYLNCTFTKVALKKLTLSLLWRRRVSHPDSCSLLSRSGLNESYTFSTANRPVLYLELYYNTNTFLAVYIRVVPRAGWYIAAAARAPVNSATHRDSIRRIIPYMT